MDDKRFDFLTIVQTCMLANSINTQPQDPEGRWRHEYSATGTFTTMQDAVYASYRIPNDKTASEAAHEFIFYILSNLRSEDAQCPSWFARG